MTHSEQPPYDAGEAQYLDLSTRLKRVEDTLAGLVAQPGGGSLTHALGDDSADTADTAAHEFGTGAEDPDPFWALHALKERLPGPGGVLCAGSVTVGDDRIEYQWSRPTEALRAADWTRGADRLAALGHPHRLAILQHLLTGERSVAQLVEVLSLASTGVAYHHLNALQHGGWVTSVRRGYWRIPPSRVIPLLTVVLAIEEA